MHYCSTAVIQSVRPRLHVWLHVLNHLTQYDTRQWWPKWHRCKYQTVCITGSTTS